MADHKSEMHKRLDRVEERFNKDLGKLRRAIDAGRIGGEEDRLWLDAQIEEGARGFDICCGDFPIGDSEGIDGDIRKLGVSHHFVNGEELSIADAEELDFVVTNYFDVFPHPMSVLQEWNRVLKRGGLLALICRDADAYEGDLGPFTNKHRCSAFTTKTIRCYLTRAGFVNIKVERTDTRSLRVRGVKA
jgi:SAM-dependent methyltransferase